MAQIFPKWFNFVPVVVAAGLIGGVALLVGGFWYFGSPKFLEVGYQPVQPLPYNHARHAGELGIDCRYCHNHVEFSRHAQVPPTKTCMNCHIIIKPESENLTLIQDSWKNHNNMRWIRVHNIPDYAYFDHSSHLGAGVGCISCHGDISKAEVVMQVEPMSMGWCLDCHRNPDEHLRPVDEITNMQWEKPPEDEHKKWVEDFKAEKNLNPPVLCSGCHR